MKVETSGTMEKIQLHHIGAAGMSWPFKNRKAFLDDFIIYLYDANKNVFFDDTGGGYTYLTGVSVVAAQQRRLSILPMTHRDLPCGRPTHIIETGI
jgi:hypothetical protein